MIRDLKAFYVLIENNEVVAYETNLTLFAAEVNEKVTGSPNYDSLYRRFRANPKFSMTVGVKEYYFQKVI